MSVFVAALALAGLGACAGPRAGAVPGAGPAAASFAVTASNATQASCTGPGQAAVRGTLVDPETQQPLWGFTVAICGQRTVTDARGEFEVPSVPARYDVFVLEEDNVSAFSGLTRREPRLPHVPRKHPRRTRQEHRAHLSVRLTEGDGVNERTPERTKVTFVFVSDGTGAPKFTQLLGRPWAPGEDGPDFGDLKVEWTGKAAVAGEVVALWRVDDVRAGTSYLIGRAPVSLTSRATGRVEIALRPTALRRISGATALGKINEITLSYELPAALEGKKGSIPFEKSRGFSFDAPVLPFGGQYCVQGRPKEPRDLGESEADTYRSRRNLHLRATWRATMRCGLAPGDEKLSLTALPTPSFSEAFAGQLRSPTEDLTWNPIEGAIYSVSVQAHLSAASGPGRSVKFSFYTAQTHLRWTDLQGFGFAFPEGCEGVMVRLVAAAPFASLDEAAGPLGLSVQTHPLLQVSALEEAGDVGKGCVEPGKEKPTAIPSPATPGTSAPQ